MFDSHALLEGPEGHGGHGHGHGHGHDEIEAIEEKDEEYHCDSMNENGLNKTKDISLIVPSID